jgi:hypothetical protein
MFTEPLPSNGRLFALHYSGLLVGGAHRHINTQQGDFISLLLLFHTESRLNAVRIGTGMKRKKTSLCKSRSVSFTSCSGKPPF